MIIDVLEQWRVWRHRIDRVRIALPQGYTTACIWVCIPLFFLLESLYAEISIAFLFHTFWRILALAGTIPIVTLYCLRVLNMRIIQNLDYPRWRTKNYAFFVFFRLFTFLCTVYTTKFTFPCIQRKSMCFSPNVSLPRLRPTYFRSVPSLSAQKKTELAKRGLDPMLRAQKITRNGQQRIRSHVQDPPVAVELYRYL